VSPPPSQRQSLLQLKELSSSSRSRITSRTSLPKRDTKALATVSQEYGQSKASPHTGEEIWPTSSATSQLRPSISLARTHTRNIFARTTPRLSQACSSLETVHLVEPLVPRHCVSYTHSISQEHVSLLTSDLVRRENSPAL
jgi:hypothetical protein